MPSLSFYRLSKPTFSFYLALVVALSSCGPDLPDDVKIAYKKLPGKLDYNQHVKPILSDKCFACHGPDKQKQEAGLRLDISSSAYGDLPDNPGKVAIDPGDLNNSELFYRIMSDDPEYMMPNPKSHLQLNAKEKAILVKWIEDGAVYKPHWAFVKPGEQKPPKVEHEKEVSNEIDNFILLRLEEESLTFSPSATKEELLRRLSFDVTGLPPSLKELDDFLSDNSPNAYEKQVDRLLASKHYGERMAVDWLDVARFADSHGYTVDRLRDMSPYRDWVINAFNKNMRYDEFLKEQLAGDLVKNPTKDMIIATAFNRNHPQNMEGGIIEEEFQAEYVVDRTITLGDGLMGLSVGCARCHDHKYDPISQKNFYELFSFFNNVKEAGQISFDDAIPSPTLMLPDKQAEKILSFIKGQIDSQEVKIEKLKTDTKGLEHWLQSGEYKKSLARNVSTKNLQGYYTFDDGTLRNSARAKSEGKMKLETGGSAPAPTFVNTEKGKALLMDGDASLDLKEVGLFRKSDYFSIGIKVFIPQDLKEGVILHKSFMERLYNFRGYHLYLKNDRLELGMSHAAPSNAITKLTRENIPREKWITLFITYDGSSKAGGLKLYADGEELPMETTMDQLSKEILINPASFGGAIQPGLQVGAWGRGFGLKNGKVDEILVYNRALTPFEIKVMSGKASWNELTALSPNELNAAQKQILLAYYNSAENDVVLKEAEQLRALRKTLADSSENVPELMIMQEMPERKKAYILERGRYDAPGEEVFPNTPNSILPFPPDFPKNRLGLAQWLVHPDHPLTARVAVNRYWQNFFGTGIVKTTEDFGNQGELPSHPELLDWLAIRFRESGWDVKALVKLMVMSTTYRQGSAATKEGYEKDPENRLLSRGPSNRLTAEMIRDNALSASGLLIEDIGGKSVKPYQPEGLWEINSMKYVPDTGKAMYRRSLYVLIKRSVPHPTLSTFDAPSRSYCVVRRQKTNTPLQALVTMNDPAFIEASRAIGEQMTKTPDTKQAIKTAYRKLCGVHPDEKIIELLSELRQKQLDNFKQHPAKTKGWLTTGQYRVDPSMDRAVIAANAVVASTIMNSDATLIKR
ncbi:MAG: DUF1553 domain-containing protein [Chitinophagaceae bacterium]|nr:DUF1553 domain-containing protein [Chitinophagaceae bacterium]